MDQSFALSFQGAGTSISFNPFEESKLAITSADNFAIAGMGRLLVVQLFQPNQCRIVNLFEETNAVFDCSWNESDPNILVEGLGDGRIKVVNTLTNIPLMEMKIHQKEIYSVENCHKNPALYLTCGSDGQAKITDIISKQLILSIQGHQGISYQGIWHPINPNMFSSVGSDGTLKLYDLNSPQQIIANYKVHDGEVISCDFNKYEEQIITGSTDKTIKVWDLRMMSSPIGVLAGHRYPIKKLRCSPHESSLVASVSYDMSVKLWNLRDFTNPLISSFDNHTEFTSAVEFSLFNPTIIASTAWDGKLYIWPFNQNQPKLL